MMLTAISACLLVATRVAATESERPSVRGAWAGEAEHLGQRLPLSIHIPGHTHDGIALVDYPGVPVLAAPFRIERDGEDLRLRRRPADAPESLIVLQQEGSELRGTFSGAGVSDAVVVLKPLANAPPPLAETSVSFSNGAVALRGTVVWPRGDGPFPAVVVAHGSGPGHREQALYRTEAFRYARLGVATLIYDKRGCGESGGDFRSASLEDLAHDALAGVAQLRRDPRIRKDLIGVAGHSQGGWIAPLAAALSREVAFVIATSASGLGPMAQSLYHNANDMRAAGFSPAQVDAAQRLRQRMYDGVRAGAWDQALQRDLAAASREPWFASSQLPTPPMSALSAGERALLLFEPLAVWRRVRVPVLAIWGEDDINLPAVRSRELIAQALREGGNEDTTLKVFTGLGHGFLRTRPADAPFDFPRGSAELEAFTAQWIRSRATEPSG